MNAQWRWTRTPRSDRGTYKYYIQLPARNQSRIIRHHYTYTGSFCCTFLPTVMFLPYLLTVSLVAFPLVAHAQSLLDALRLADAPAFAEYIGANPALLAQLSDPAVKTIFAPNDKAMEIFLSNGTINKRLLARQSPNNDRKTAQQSSNEAQAAAGLKTPPGRVVQTNHPGPGGKVVGQPGSNTGNSTGGVARRQQSTGPQAIIFSGLGNNVTIVKEDTPFYNGLIQTTDGYGFPSG